jgi:hypothetical protein
VVLVEGVATDSEKLPALAFEVLEGRDAGTTGPVAELSQRPWHAVTVELVLVMPFAAGRPLPPVIGGITPVIVGRPLSSVLSELSGLSELSVLSVDVPSVLAPS